MPAARRGRPNRSQKANASVLAQAAPAQQQQPQLQQQEESPTLTAHLSQTRFSSFVESNLLSRRIRLPFEFCTDVQAQTLPVILQKGDVLAQAKTGTGKTLAFLLPVIQSLVLSPPEKGQIGAIVISPTRELAAQIALAGEPLLKDLPFKIQVATGGTNVRSEIKRLQQQRCDILVATPGRLLDHLANNGLQPHTSKLRNLVLDEADRLLDQGFKQDIEKIVHLLPDRRVVQRQSLLFSATLPQGVQDVARFTLDPSHTFISTLKEDEVNTHQHVPQSVQICKLEDLFVSLVSILRQELAKTANSKIMLFLPTARSTGLVYEMLANLETGVLSSQPLPVLQIHSRMSQPARTKAADAFKAAKTGILVSSDVTARGMDFPLVTLVVQAGLPADTEQYIHRLGRTARAGEGGSGILLLCDFEAFFLNQRTVKELPIEPYSMDTAYLVDAVNVDQALDKVPEELKAQAWQAWLGYYKPSMKKMHMDVPQLAQRANDFAFGTCRLPQRGLKSPPILATTLGKMGFKAHRNLFNVVSVLPGKEGR